MGWQKCPLFKICHRYPTVIKLGTVIVYLKRIKSIYELRDTSLEFCWNLHFFTRNQQILLYQERQIWIAFWYIISNSFNFPWASKDCFSKHGYNLDDFSKNGYLIISAYDITNKILSCDSNFIIDVVMWLKFGNSSISMKEVIITSIL